MVLRAGVEPFFPSPHPTGKPRPAQKANCVQAGREIAAACCFVHFRPERGLRCPPRHLRALFAHICCLVTSKPGAGNADLRS